MKMETYEIDTLSEGELQDCLILLTQRYNDLVIITSALELNGNITVKQTPQQTILQSPFISILNMKNNINILHDTLLACQERLNEDNTALE